MYLSNTTLFDARDMYRIYYTENNYMFQHLPMAFFRLRNEKKLSSSHTRLTWGVYSLVVRGEVGTRSCMCYVGRARSRAQLTSYFPTVYTPHKSSIAAY